MRIKDVFLINPSSKKYKDFINYIDTSSVQSGRLDNIQYMESNFPSRAQREILYGDILYSSVRPNLRHYYLYTDCYEHAVASSGFVLLRRKDDQFDVKFGYYYLSSIPIVRYLSNIAELSQATFPSFSAKDLGKINLPSFELNVQHRIASILSTYDTLIENHTKRIRLLEKMAENLYKEWFVRFRFPGHENVKMVNGLPNGWKKGALSDVCEFKRGKNITSSEMKDGTIPVISAGITPSGFHSHANVYGISVTMSSSGANAGYIAVHYSDIWAADCSYIEEASTPCIYYVYELLNNIRSIINNFQRGAAQPHVYPKDINRIKMIIPSEDIRKKANEKIGVIHRHIDNLQRQNSLLARQRDLLLPRLMSGKLEV